MASEIHAVVVGDNNVGKTSLCIMFSTDQFPSLFTPMEVNRVPHEKDITIGADTVHIRCTDIEGHEDYDDTRPESYDGVDVFILCFSLSGPTSFQNIRERWIPELKQHAPKAPILLVGCKEDLRRGHEKDKLVTKKQASTLSKKINAKGYIECSALKKINVMECFTMAAKIAQGKSVKEGGCGCTVL